MNTRRSAFALLRVLVRVFAGLIFLAGLTPVSSPAQAAGPWYVAPGGKDSSTCLAISSPCATIGGVLNKAGFTNGDIINVAAGTYTGTGNQVVRFAANKGAVLNGGWDAGFTTQSGLSVLDGQSARRVVSIDFAVVSMNHFTIQHGYSLTGAGIRVVNMGSLTFTDGYILNNRAPLDSGASVGRGVYYMGRFLDIKRTVAYGNEANGGSFFYGSGTVLFEQVDAYANPSNYHEFAFEGGTFTFYHSKLHDQQGTVIYAYASRGYMNDTSISNNSGVAIVADESQRLNLSNVSIENNQAGGLVMQYAQQLTMVNSAITGNRHAQGGGLYLFDSPADIINSTITGNHADERGGGIYAINSRVALYNATLYNNTAQTGGAIFNDSVDPYYATQLQNSLLVGNNAAEAKNCAGMVASAGHNLVDVRVGCAYTAGSGDIFPAPGTDLPLGVQNGQPAYIPLLPGSPAVDAGDPTGCKDQAGAVLAADQRGLPRFGVCDIGAYELQLLEYSTMQASPAKARVGDPLTYTINIVNPGADEISGVELTNALASGLEFIPGTLSATRGTPGYANGSITWSGNLSAHDQVTVSYQATIRVPLPPEQAIVNEAKIQGDGETIWLQARAWVDAYQTYCPIGRR